MNSLSTGYRTCASSLVSYAVCLKESGQETGPLTPVGGSYSWFLCQSLISALPGNDCPDETSVVIHTRQRTLKLNIANLTDTGEPVPFDQIPNLTVQYLSLRTFYTMHLCRLVDTAHCMKYQEES